MRIEFHEQFNLPVEEVFAYFRTPADWVRLYGMFGAVEERGDGWQAVPLRGFPFPLVAKVTESDENRIVRWTFRSFWRGGGEVRFTVSPAGTTVDGYEEISVRWLGLVSPIVERLFLEHRFRGIWRHGWKRLRKLEGRQRVESPA
jgi:hypothetical protein